MRYNLNEIKMKKNFLNESKRQEALEELEKIVKKYIMDLAKDGISQDEAENEHEYELRAGLDHGEWESGKFWMSPEWPKWRKKHGYDGYPAHWMEDEFPEYWDFWRKYSKKYLEED